MKLKINNHQTITKLSNGFMEILEDKKEISMKTKTHEEMIRQVREAGESLIKNAESIVGSEEFLVDGMTVTIDINVRDSAPTIEVKREFLPEMYVKRIGG